MAQSNCLNLTRRGFLGYMGAAAGVFGLGLGGFSCSSNPEKHAKGGKKPNVVLIVPDDLGYADLGCQGCRDIPTPFIDSIADNGVRFTDAYVTAPVCSPSRAGLLSGIYQQRFGYEYNVPYPQAGKEPDPNEGLPTDVKNIAEYLKTAGYKTAAIGKWHLGFADEYLPNNRGFDEFFGMRGGSINYLQIDPPQSGDMVAWYQDLYRNNEVVAEDEYTTDAFAREADNFIRKQDGKDPFFLYLAFNAVHEPIQATKKYESRFEGKIDDPTRLTYAAMTSAMDDAVGRVLKALKDKGLEDDTLIIFVNDNGGPKSTGSSNAPLRGWKSSLQEGGIRVPMVVQWKGKIPAGKTYKSPVISIDILPTILAAADLQPQGNVEGVNLIPFLTGNTDDNPHKILFWRYGNVWAARKGDWKVIGRESTGIIRLYNLAENIDEKEVTDMYPEIVQELRKDYLLWNRSNLEPAWLRPVDFPKVP